MLLLIAQMGLWETIKRLLIAISLPMTDEVDSGGFFLFFFLPLLSGAVNWGLYAPADHDFPVLAFRAVPNFPCNFLLFRDMASAVLGDGCTCPCDYLTLQHLSCPLASFCCCCVSTVEKSGVLEIRFCGRDVCLGLCTCAYPNHQNRTQVCSMVTVQ